MAHCSRSNAELPGDIALSPQALLMVFTTDQPFQSAVKARLLFIEGENNNNSKKATVPKAHRNT